MENGKRAAAVTVRNAYRAQITASITEHYVGVAHKKEELILTNMPWLLARWMQLNRVTEAMGESRPSIPMPPSLNAATATQIIPPSRMPGSMARTKSSMLRP